ncbi:MAG: Rieske 2Fe-2S domain-containing protein [Pseudomonadota bacterium]
MSVKYIPVQWNSNKWLYDAVLLVSVAVFVWLFLYVVPDWLGHARPADPAVTNARAFGLCAFTMMSVILAIGPLARLDERFLPLLYNRRHFGVLTLFVALTHTGYILGWYFAFSPVGQLENLLSARTDWTQVAGFPFEFFGVFSIICLMILATTSHDFWMKFLTPPIWKGLHYLIYPAYAAVVGHVAWGVLMDQRNQALTWVILVMAVVVAGLHLAAAWADRKGGDARAESSRDGWVRIGSVDEIAEGRAKIAVLPGGDRVAVFRHKGALSAISNHCAHQNGPLGEGRIVDCLVTCPWHGFQYDVRTGQSPAPFTEKVPTYAVVLEGRDVLVNPLANPPGTPTDAAPIPEAV